jgi:hypothetical protein
MVVALVTLISPTTHAAKPAGAQLGTVSVGGSLTSGSQLNYQFNLTVTTNTGTLVVKATIIGKKFKANFPALTINNPAVGVSSNLPGTSVQIPSTFTGPAVVRVTATFSKKKIGAQTVPVSITATPPPPTSLTVTTNLYDVGFENSVTLDGSIVPTSGMTGPLTYTWSQTSGKAVTLRANGVVPQTSFTTDALTNFVGMSVGIFVNDVDDHGNTNALYIPPEHRFGNMGGVALDNEQASAAIYGFKLLVSGGSGTRTGLFTVACSLQTPAQPNIPLGVTAFFKGAANSTSWSLLSAPVGSAAVLTHTNGLIAQLRPDVEGLYVIRDNVTGQTLTNTAATWTGYQFCAICHGPNNNVGQRDMVTPWSQTLHSTMAQRGIDGVLGSSYNQSCLQCHTVGYNQSPAATNGNFYAVQQATGWQFPKVLTNGNFAAAPAALQNVANIQCESCHGPGSRHPGAPSISLDERVCASCHQNGTHHIFPGEWETSPHSGAYEQIADSEGTNPSCARCHSPNGFVDATKRLNSGVPLRTIVAGGAATGAGPLTCQACHDPHNVAQFPAEAHQLRAYDSVTLGDPNKTNGVVNPDGSLTLGTGTVTFTNMGVAAVCMSCHNERAVLPYQNAGTISKPVPTYMKSLPHESPVAEVLMGVGAANQGLPMGNSFHTYLANCTTCHMYGSSATVGAHTFSMTDRVTGAENLAACNQCHTEPVTDFDFKAVNAGDYDGDGVIDGVQTEVQGLLTILSNKFADVGITVSDGYPFIDAASYTSVTNAYPSEAAPIRRALWNRVLIVREGSFGIHNTQFTVRLLQSSYTDLSTNCISQTTHTNGNPFAVDYPQAYLR